MNDAQQHALKRFNEYWVVDYNFQNEPIVYSHVKQSPMIEENIIDVYGKIIKTGEFLYTMKLQKELKQY